MSMDYLVCQFAASYTGPIQKLKDVGFNYVSAFGAVVAVFGIVRFGLALQKNDQHGEFQAIATFGAGAIMFFGPQIVAALGM